MRNHMTITTFIMLGLTDDPQLQVLLFNLSLTYVLSITGNLTIIILTVVDPHLKIPMYLFLRKFSFLEVSFTTVYITRFLYSLSTENNIITYNAYACQIFFVILFEATEFFLLAAMSYDCFAAICKPLHYMTIMNNRVCILLVFSCWVSGWMIIVPALSLGLQLEFCDSNTVDHFKCDASPLLKTSCSDTWVIEQMIILVAVFALIITLFCVILSYIHIIKTIVRFPSAQQRKKAFSTCSSHMIMVSMIYGSCTVIYIKPSAKEEVTINKGVSVLMTSVAPF
ncbi:olfactory receptor 6C2 [Heterocephalus glaber]|uniref:Olfactory receptor 6C2 n=1 Tax=Heterocephalus glaber TaxID=10181 RepID=A0AAX6R3N9_HETGA|nr:olfactory receptor 6C2 [Heterocephalus glaber]